MALPPQTNEAFLREVDEQVRLDQAARFWKRWGRAVVVLFIIALAAFGGYLWWRSSQVAAAGVEGENLSVALDNLSAGNMRKAEPALTTLAGSGVPGYRVAAQLALADVEQTKGNPKAAAASYDKIAADASLAQPYRDLALIRSVAAKFDTMKPEEAIARLKPLAVVGNPWFGTAGEMTAVSYMRLNRNREAAAVFAGIARDESVPESIRSRSIQLATVLGVDIKPTTGLSRN